MDNLPVKSDLDIFIEKYQPSKFKKLKNSVEVRSVNDLEKATNKATELIKCHKLAWWSFEMLKPLVEEHLKFGRLRLN